MSPKDSPHSPSAMANQQYCLKWNNHQSNLLRAFDRLLQSESFTDVTLACEGRSLRAHKVVLSACSSYFEQLFEEHPDKSPIIILKDMKFAHVSQLVNFMYRGEINITQDMLSGLLKTAETLKVKGLAEVSGDQPVQAVNPIPPVLRLAISRDGMNTLIPASPHVVRTQELLQHSRQASLPQMVAPSNSPLTTALNAPLVGPPTLAPLAALLNPDGSPHVVRTQELLQHSRQASLPQMVPPSNSPLTTALNTPLVGPPTLVPLAALLDPNGLGLDERRVNLLKRMSQEHEAVAAHSAAVTAAATAAVTAAVGGGGGGGGGGGVGDIIHEPPQKVQRREQKEEPDPSQQLPHASLFMSPQDQMAASKTPPMQNVLTPIPHELTVNSQAELPDFLKSFTVFKLNDYLGFRTRQQFWEEPAVRRILEGIKNKEIDMKSAAELIGVSYGTLYGRYREVFGYLKHSWVNKPGRNTPGSGQKERSIWEESRAQELIQRVLSKELSLTAAAVRLGVDTNTFFAHITDNGKNKTRVALLLGTDANTENSFMIANHSEDSDPINSGIDPLDNSGIDPLGDDSNPPPYHMVGQGNEDSNMEGVMENSHVGPEMNGDDNEEPEIIEDSNDPSRSLEIEEQVPVMQEMTEPEEEAVEDQVITGETQESAESMETFQSIVEEDSGNVCADASLTNN